MSDKVELKVGFFVICGIASLFIISVLISSNNIFFNSGYEIIARFDNVGGMKVNAPVTLAGVKIGRVANINIDKKDYDAIVTLRISDEYNNLPSDTAASVYSTGIMGDNYIELNLGGEITPLLPGDELRFTQSALILEKVIGQFLFKTAEK